MANVSAILGHGPSLLHYTAHVRCACDVMPVATRFTRCRLRCSVGFRFGCRGAHVVQHKCWHTHQRRTLRVLMALGLELKYLPPPLVLSQLMSFPPTGGGDGHKVRVPPLGGGGGCTTRLYHSITV